jgi:redox-sensitive bicupin YhaK (pirin superfamily)
MTANIAGLAGCCAVAGAVGVGQQCATQEAAMPARTVDDLGTLPSITVEPTALARPVVSVTTAPSGLEGEGFPVRRAFAGVHLARLDPFVHMDQMGAVDYGPGEPKGTPWHPHRGFETVTYMIDGTFQHQDSIGGGGLIRDGDTQWMTAGAGILHIERPPEAMVASGGLFHGIQLWVNLPSSAKWIAPRYQDIRGDEVAMASAGGGGGLVRVIAGSVGAARGPGRTHTPITLAHVTVQPAARLVLPWDRSYNALVYALAGAGTVGAERAPLAAGQLAVLGPGDSIVLQANDRQDGSSPTFDVLLLGGQPIGEPVVAYGPFVMNTRQEIADAFEDFRAGRLGTIPADHIGS